MARTTPPPTRIATAAIKYLTTADGREMLFFHLFSTLRRLAIGYTIGATLGVIGGVVMGLTPVVRYAVTPMIFGLFPMPKIAIYPLVIIIFGLGDVSSIALVALGVFFMTCINTLSGVSNMSPIYHDVAAVFRIPAATRWTRVVLPAAMPAVVTGLRLGLGQALILVVSSEFVSADSGIGRFIWDSWQVLDIPRMFIGLACVLILGASSALAGDFLERRFVPWKRQ
jgi:NitT/TauT family transport system permease protein